MGLSSGRTTLKNRETGPAPSMAAASMTDGEMDCRPAMKMTMLRPRELQIVTRHTAMRASHGWPSQSIGSMPSVLVRKPEMTPSARSSCCQMRAMATELVTTGARNSTR